MSEYGIPPDLPKSKTSFSPCHYRHFCYICKNHSTHETPQNRGFVSFGSSTFCNVMRCSTARTQPAPSSASQGGPASPSRTPQTAEAPTKSPKSPKGRRHLRPTITATADNAGTCAKYNPFRPSNIDGPKGILCFVKARYYRRADNQSRTRELQDLNALKNHP